MKKKITLLLASLLVIATACVSAAKKNSQESTRVVGNFDEIEIGVGISATFTQGPKKAVRMTGPAEQLQYVTADVKKGKLTIRYARNHNLRVDGIHVYIQAPEVTEFDISTGASMSIPSGIKTYRDVEFDLNTGASLTVESLTANKVELDCNTGASANIRKIKSTSVEVDCNTGATVTLSGNTSMLEVDAGTGATVNARNLKANTGKIDAGTAANVEVNVRHIIEQESGTGASITNRH